MSNRNEIATASAFFVVLVVVAMVMLLVLTGRVSEKYRHEQQPEHDAAPMETITPTSRTPSGTTIPPSTNYTLHNEVFETAGRLPIVTVSGGDNASPFDDFVDTMRNAKDGKPTCRAISETVIECHDTKNGIRCAFDRQSRLPIYCTTDLGAECSFDSEGRLKSCQNRKNKTTCEPLHDGMIRCRYVDGSVCYARADRDEYVCDEPEGVQCMYRFNKKDGKPLWCRELRRRIPG